MRQIFEVVNFSNKKQGVNIDNNNNSHTTAGVLMFCKSGEEFQLYGDKIKGHLKVRASNNIVA